MGDRPPDSMDMDSSNDLPASSIQPPTHRSQAIPVPSTHQNTMNHPPSSHYGPIAAASLTSAILPSAAGHHHVTIPPAAPPPSSSLTFPSQHQAAHGSKATSSDMALTSSSSATLSTSAPKRMRSDSHPHQPPMQQQEPAALNPPSSSSSHHHQQQQKQILTRPSLGVRNDGYDNEHSDLILIIGDPLIHYQSSGSTRHYVISDMLGQGTFGQVASCWCEELGREVAIKVIKNLPAYYHQARVEIGLLQFLNTRCDANDEHHIVRMMDYFLFKKHLCIVFEKLDVNLFELLKRNGFRGLSLSLVQLFLRQILDSLSVLRDASIIHCDLKPENILLSNATSGEIKLIDFGSACFESRTVYSYIQSRFYRSPEVVLGSSYNVSIDMWSLGCVAAELFLGLPLFPGSSEHDLMARIIETLGVPPDWLIKESKNSKKYFRWTPQDSSPPSPSPSPFPSSEQPTPNGSSNKGGSYTLLSKQEFEAINPGVQATAGKRYFSHVALADIVHVYPMRTGLSDEEVGRERARRESFCDLLFGVLDLDPKTRWTPRQAAQHPFVLGTTFNGPFQPPPDERRKIYAPDDFSMPNPMLHSSQPHMNPHQGNNAPLPSHQAQVHGQGAMMGSSLMTHMASSVPNKTYVPSSAAPQPYHGSTSYTSMGGGGGGAEGGPSSSSSLHGCGSGSGSGPMMSGGILGYGPLSSSFTPSSQGAAVGTGVGSVGFGLGGSSRPEDQANAALAALALKHQQAQAHAIALAAVQQIQQQQQQQQQQIQQQPGQSSLPLPFLVPQGVQGHQGGGGGGGGGLLQLGHLSPGDMNGLMMMAAAQAARQALVHQQQGVAAGSSGLHDPHQPNLAMMQALIQQQQQQQQQENQQRMLSQAQAQAQAPPQFLPPPSWSHHYQSYAASAMSLQHQNQQPQAFPMFQQQMQQQQLQLPVLQMQPTFASALQQHQAPSQPQSNRVDQSSMDVDVRSGDDEIGLGGGGGAEGGVLMMREGSQSPADWDPLYDDSEGLTGEGEGEGEGEDTGPEASSSSLRGKSHATTRSGDQDASSSPEAPGRMAIGQGQGHGQGQGQGQGFTFPELRAPHQL